jgi:hypothetical protein
MRSVAPLGDLVVQEVDHFAEWGDELVDRL